MEEIVAFIDLAFKLAKEIQVISGPKLVDWKAQMAANEGFKGQISALKATVEKFALRFPLPGYADI
jgi:hypothetical protein